MLLDWRVLIGPASGVGRRVASSAPPGRCVVGWVIGSTGGASLYPWLQAFAPLGRGLGEDDPTRGRLEKVEQLILGNLLRVNLERSGA